MIQNKRVIYLINVQINNKINFLEIIACNKINSIITIEIF